MADELPIMTLKTIGSVRSEIKQAAPYSQRDWQKVVSEIVMDKNLTEALDGLEEFSHIIVLYWMHKATSRGTPLKIHPRGNPELPLVGFFATRSPNRTNPIGETTVRLLERRGNVLKVQGLDAIDGTPVIDIKPYLPETDWVADAKLPQWITKR